MQTIFVTATNTNVGKTHTTKKLIELFSHKNIKVGICKPIETGVLNEPLDATELLHTVQQYNINFKPLKPADITAYTFKLPASPFSADTQKIIKIEAIKAKIAHLQTLCDLLIIEGAGGVMVPITANYFMIDLAQELQAMTLLVTPSKLGCINDTLLSIEALKNRKMHFDWCVNLYEDKNYFQEITQPFYDEVFPHWWSSENGLENFVIKYIETQYTSSK
ncbi:MAG: ATP-dependent dethiobiotin synthetase BioD [Sulfurovum sp. FS06-10]|nr:MAG: ATP-dependent dethiobiotin synthetase BioD [Sulfurovum sp. FS06-10]